MKKNEDMDMCDRDHCIIWVEESVINSLEINISNGIIESLKYGKLLTSDREVPNNSQKVSKQVLNLSHNQWKQIHYK